MIPANLLQNSQYIYQYYLIPFLRFGLLTTETPVQAFPPPRLAVSTILTAQAQAQDSNDQRVHFHPTFMPRVGKWAESNMVNQASLEERWPSG